MSFFQCSSGVLGVVLGVFFSEPTGEQILILILPVQHWLRDCIIHSNNYSTDSNHARGSQSTPSCILTDAPRFPKRKGNPPLSSAPVWTGHIGKSTGIFQWHLKHQQHPREVMHAGCTDKNTRTRKHTKGTNPVGFQDIRLFYERSGFCVRSEHAEVARAPTHSTRMHELPKLS